MNDGIDLLQLVLNFETKDPLILSCVLTNVSALFPFVTYRPEYLPQVLSKVGTCRPCLKSGRLFVVQGPCTKLQELILLMLLLGKCYPSC